MDNVLEKKKSPKNNIAKEYQTIDNSNLQGVQKIYQHKEKKYSSEDYDIRNSCVVS